MAGKLVYPIGDDRHVVVLLSDVWPMNPRRRILAVSPYFDNTSGVGTVARFLADNLANQGHMVDTLEYRPWLDALPYKLTSGRKEHEFASSSHLVDCFRRQNARYDVIHFHNQVMANGLNENVFRYFRSTPKLMQVHCVIPYDNAVLANKSHHNHEELQRQVRMINKVDRVVHLTEEVDAIAKQYYGREHTASSTVIHNAAKPPAVDPAKAGKLRRALAPDGEKTYLFAGRLSEEKGVLELAAGFRKAKQRHAGIKLVLCGDNCSNPSIKDSIRTGFGELVEGKDFVFMGKVSQEELATFYAACDFFIQPSRYEHFSVSAVEAFSHKIPVLMTRMSSIQRTFRMGAADTLVIPIEQIGSANAIAAAIDRSMRTPPRDLEAVTARAYAFYAHALTPQKITADFEREYEMLIRARSWYDPSEHVYIVPVAPSDGDPDDTVNALLKYKKWWGVILISSYQGYRPSKRFSDKYRELIEEGTITILHSERDITKYKSNALNKGLSEAARYDADHVSVVLPGCMVNARHKAQLRHLSEETLLVHGSLGSSNDSLAADPRSLAEKLKTGNPIHLSTITMTARMFDTIGFFYDSMSYAEDMDFYQKLLSICGERAITDSGMQVLSPQGEASPVTPLSPPHATQGGLRAPRSRGVEALRRL